MRGEVEVSGETEWIEAFEGTWREGWKKWDWDQVVGAKRTSGWKVGEREKRVSEARWVKSGETVWIDGF